MGLCLCVAAGRAAPSWDQLYETASAQEGQFTTQQAAEAGYSPQLLTKHLRSGRVVRVRRGIYRIVHFPPGDREELVTAWLWTEREGVFSHETALALHGLSDALPARVHVTLPLEWLRRRLRVPAGVALHHAAIDGRDRVWSGPVPATSPAKTLADCVEAHLDPELIERALSQAASRGIIGRAELRRLRARHGGSAR